MDIEVTPLHDIFDLNPSLYGVDQSITLDSGIDYKRVLRVSSRDSVDNSVLTDSFQIVERQVDHYDALYLEDLWKIYQNAGLPVVKFFRRKGDSIFTEDVTADGSKLYGKALRQLLDQNSNLDCTSNSEHTIFTQLLETYITDIQAHAGSMANKASDAGIWLPYDDPMELIVHPDGTWGTITLDLINTRLTNLSKRPELTQRIIDTNHKYVSLFIQDLETIHQHLSS